jgi:hypothetical protein
MAPSACALALASRLCWRGLIVPADPFVRSLLMPVPAVVLFAHGARDPAWANPFHALRDALLRAQPERRVEIAFLELMSPSLPDLVAELCWAGPR